MLVVRGTVVQLYGVILVVPDGNKSGYRHPHTHLHFPSQPGGGAGGEHNSQQSCQMLKSTLQSDNLSGDYELHRKGCWICSKKYQSII